MTDAGAATEAIVSRWVGANLPKERAMVCDPGCFSPFHMPWLWPFWGVLFPYANPADPGMWPPY
ncbi:hypothetical protein [Rhodococcus jostii]|uniref:hypothetical protein n=1 Tax=Rhodococcus jostii TaxID=132919 RepID=UPI00365346E6